MDEKMKILEMLDAGKITPEQASVLIKAIGEQEASHSQHSNQVQHSNQTKNSNDTNNTYQNSHIHHNAHSSSDAPRHNGPRAGESKGPSFGEIAADLGVRLGGIAKEWEPKVKEIAGVMAEKTVDFADKVTKEVTKAVDPKPSARPSSSGGQYSSHHDSRMRSEPARPTTRPGQRSERSFELIVSNAASELVLAGFNAPVTVKGYNGDKISAKISYKAKQPSADIELISYGSKYILNYDAAAFSEVAIDAYVPEKLFSTVNISNANAVLNISSISAVNFSASCAGAPTVLANISAETLSVSASGGKLELASIYAKDGRIDAVNSVISAANLDIKDMKLESSNAPINLSISDYAGFSEYKWIVETSNGRISANIPSAPALGYHIKAASALGSVKLGLTGMEYSLNSNANVEARSANFDSCAKRVSISFESSNDSIIIN